MTFDIRYVVILICVLFSFESISGRLQQRVERNDQEPT
jgi:hypothetical protein